MKEVVHGDPAWREQGDSTLALLLEIGDDPALHRVERLWCRRLSAQHFELCCIPFFAYNMALGDVLYVEPDEVGFAAVQDIARPSQHSTVRIWFGESPVPHAAEELLNAIRPLGGWREVSSTRLVAVDVESDDQRQQLLGLLTPRREQGLLWFEVANVAAGAAKGLHLQPAWAARADFRIYAQIEEQDRAVKWEQLAARRLADNRFEICCVPFFAYNLALGDEVDAHADGVGPYVVQQVLKRSGHWTFRALFEEGADPEAGARILQEVQQAGGLIEVYSPHLVGVDAAAADPAQVIADILANGERQGCLAYETGRL